MALIDDLFASIDTIVSARMANVPYDQTIECEIVAAIDKMTYLVEYQNATFTAYSTSEDIFYKQGDIVYINIPQGDFAENKFIISKKQQTEVKKVKGLPFLNFLKGNNFFTQGERNKEYSIKINDPNTENVIKTFYPTTGGVYAGYTKLGIKGAFNSSITNDMASGDYGIRIRLNGYDQTQTYLSTTQASDKDSTALTMRELDLFTKDMVGANHYNTLGYVNQEQVFDITNFAITSISVILYQDNNFITISGDRLTERRIQISNLQLYLGYDANVYTNTEKPYAILYTRDGLLYDTNILQKNIEVRFIQRLEDDLRYNIINNYETNRLYEFYWEKYNIYADENKGNYSDLPLYETLDITDIDISNKSLIQKVNLPSARNRIYAGFVFVAQGTGTQSANKIVSNELYFTNAAYLANSEVVDLVLGLQADPKESEDESQNYNGKYFIYGQDNHATDLITVAKKHYLSITYTSVSESDNIQGLQPGDIITWKIPATSSMILPAATDEIVTPILDNDGTFFVGTVILSDNYIMGKDRVFKLPYYINEYYSPSYTNNTIQVSLNRKSSLFNTTCELLFGTSGSQGSEYSVRIILKQNDQQIYTVPLNNSKNIVAEAEIYNYDNKIITDIKDVVWSLIIPEEINSNNQLIKTTEIDGSYNCRLNFTTKDDNNNDIPLTEYIKQPTILKAEIQREDYSIFGYFPIAICEGSESNDANGTTLLIYDITGKKPAFTKTGFQLKNYDNSELDWIIEPEDSELVWKPILTDYNELAGPSIYVKNSNRAYYTLVAYKKGTKATPRWLSAIYMFQHKYPNATDYPEFNQVSINNDSYIIESTVAGRVSATGEGENEKISGIFLGNVKNSTTAETSKLGLYAFHDNTLFAEINEDGYIFLDGITEDESETGAIVIKDAYLTSCTIDNSSLSGDITANNATNDSDGNKINTTYLKLTGGTMSGSIKWKDDTALPTMTNTPTYAFVLDSSNNTTKKINLTNISVGHASTATTANDYNINTGTIKSKLDSLQNQINSLQSRIEILENNS